MLPKELLEVRRVRGKIIPVFASEKDVELAEKVLKVFKSGIGKKYGSVLKALREIETADNFKKVRGFAKILENYCVDRACSIDSELIPKDIRMFLFERGYVTSKEERDKVIEYAAKYFGVSVEEIERAMYADREEELLITRVESITPQEIVKRYNLSLLQTALFDSISAILDFSGNYSRIFRAIKYYGLMYDFISCKEVVEVEVTGPASLIKMTRKYGTAIAKVLPELMRADWWRIKAKILDGSRIYELEIDSSKRNLFPELKSKEKYDSSLEEEFCRRMRNLGYEIRREQVVVKAGNKAFIPDFVVWKKSWKNKVYVEIAGFWTVEYIKKKVEKIREAKIPLVVIAREEFGDVRGAEFNTELVIFSKKFDYGKILRAINKLAKKEKDQQKNISELKEKVKEVRDFEELERILKECGLGINDSILKKLGINVVWKGLKAEITHHDNNSNF